MYLHLIIITLGYAVIQLPQLVQFLKHWISGKCTYCFRYPDAKTATFNKIASLKRNHRRKKIGNPDKDKFDLAEFENRILKKVDTKVLNMINSFKKDFTT